MLVLLLGSSMVAAPEGDVDLTRMAELPVVLTDEGGKAIAGAEVMPYAMRMREEPGHGFWNRELLGPPKAVTSDQTGTAVIKYPIHVQRGPKVLTTSLVTFQIAHAEFVKQIVHFELGPERAKVTLKAGCEAELSAVGPEGAPIEDFAVAMAGPYEPEFWVRSEMGGKRTRSINDGTWQTMLVKLQEDGSTLFSGVLPLRVRPQQTVRVRNVPLSPGAKVRGTLSRNVPRPVSGYVIATSVPKPAEDSWNDTNPSLAWHDWVDVAEDGTFEFSSLPRGGQLQLIGVCDGWISTTTVPDAPPVFTMGQLFEVNDESLDVELQMEPTGTLVVKLATEEGKPFKEGRVVSWPNQAYYKGGSTLLGQRYRSATMIANQSLPPNERQPIIQNLVLPYNQPVDNEGVATLKGLPIGRNLSIALQHDEYALVSDGARQEVQFELTSPQPLQMEVKVAAGQE